MKVIFFTKYARLGASSRLRTFQYIPFYEASGITCVVNSLFNEQYLKELYNKKKLSKLNIIKSYLKRFYKLFSVRDFNIVVIEKELFPYLPSFGESLLNFFEVPFIVDYDDAIFLNYDLHPNFLVKKVLGKKIYSVMKRANTVIVGNDYLALKAKEAGAKRTVIIPTVVDTDKYRINDRKKSEKVVIGWIGSPTTLKYVKEISPVLLQISSQSSTTIHLVGGKSGINVEDEKIIEWSEDSEIKSIQDFDIGIMPLAESEWEKGKCGYKLIQYMACGVPVIGSPVGANNQIIQHGVNGYKVSSAEEWKVAFEKLINSSELRTKMGLSGRILVETKYSLQQTAKTWLREICDLADRNKIKFKYHQ